MQKRCELLPRPVRGAELCSFLLENSLYIARVKHSVSSRASRARSYAFLPSYLETVRFFTIAKCNTVPFEFYVTPGADDAAAMK